MLLHNTNPPPPKKKKKKKKHSTIHIWFHIWNPSTEPVFNKHTYKQFRMLSKQRAHFLLNLTMQLVLTHINFSVSYLILALCLKAAMFGNVWFLLQPPINDLAISNK